MSTTIPWAPGNWSSDGAGANERTPELKTLVQQIVNNPNWNIGNAMAFLFEGTGTKSAYARDTDVGKSAKLIIKFTYVSHPVGIQEFGTTFIETVSLYPNPTKNIVRVDVNHSNPFMLEVFSLNGQMVFSVGNQIETTFINFEDLQLRLPERIIAKAIKGMLPKNRLGRKLFTKLKVYKGEEHPHMSQKPKNIEL